MPPTPVPPWAVAARRFTSWLSEDFGGGPRPCPVAWIINFQKGGTFLFLGGLMAWYHNTSPGAWIFLAMHGTYGVVWLLKDLAFPDPGWRRPVTILGGLNVFLWVLGLYWGFGWLLISRTAEPRYPLPVFAWYALCISLCMFGAALMIAADAQKYFTLRLKPGLITDGVHRWIRHPNYAGEMLIYASLALMVWHPFPALVLAWVWLGVFAPNMAHKEASLSRHPGWAEYRKHSWWIIPFVL